MFFKDKLNEYKNKNIKIFVDMDGVIADYDVAKRDVYFLNYEDKRPLYTSIKKLEEVSNQNNITFYILSISRSDAGVEQKNNWIDKYAPFFKKENRIIISKESNKGFESKELKAGYLKNMQRDDSIIMVIEDDPEIIKEIRNENEDIILFKDTVLVD